jgi:IMP dehydrogenase
MNKTISFGDVLLVPQYSEIISRKEVDLSCKISKDVTVKIPIISSPMDTVTGVEMAVAMSQAGGLGILHRYNSPLEQQEMAEKALQEEKYVAAAIGVTGDYIERATLLIKSGVQILCLDIAHGHHTLMRHALSVLRNTFGHQIHLMAGNVATLEGFNDLSDWGADSIRVGIGGGSICSTRIQTGHGVPTFQSIVDCSFSDRNTLLIADGGIKNSGDITKALAAGADLVMVGSLLAGTDQSPGEVISRNGEKFKAYRGMASKEAQIEWRGHFASIEGVSSAVPCKGDVSRVLKELETGIRSGLSYTGANNISELQSKSKFVEQTQAGQLESSAHINRRK